MPLTPAPLLATSLKAVARSFLLSLGVDHVLVDFLANAAVGALAILFVILLVGFRIRPSGHRSSKPQHPQRASLSVPSHSSRTLPRPIDRNRLPLYTLLRGRRTLRRFLPPARRYDRPLHGGCCGQRPPGHDVRRPGHRNASRDSQV